MSGPPKVYTQLARSFLLLATPDHGAEADQNAADIHACFSKIA